MIVTPAFGADIKGKWGIGAGLFNRASEASMLYGHSNRTAWLFTLGLHQAEAGYNATPVGPFVPPQVRTLRSVQGGPGLRVFTRPDADFSPYLDVFAQCSWSKEETTPSGHTDIWGTRAGISFGLEYFTDWHFSVAAHSEVFALSYSRAHTEDDPFTGQTVTSHEQRADLSISPGLVLRAYF